MFQSGENVRYLYDNSTGVITGETSEEDGEVLYEVRFASGRCMYIGEEDLSLVPRQLNIWQRFSRLDFESISDLRRTMYQYRLSGGLTNLIYSMNNNKAQFFAHQFIPVTRFLESNNERLLIADEVGLGKTIESMYIWEEIKARYNAGRLLIVVPAILREKWKGDLEKYFDIDARIVSSQSGPDSLYEILSRNVNNNRSGQYVLIVSIQGIRIADGVRELFAKNAEVRHLFDLVIIDEAQCLNNAETESYKTALQLRNVASRLLLLSATPIQTSSENFYNLLHLLEPEEYFDRRMFEGRLIRNIPLVRLANAIERYNGGNEEEVKQLLEAVRSDPVFESDPDCQLLSMHLEDVLSDVRSRINVIGRLKEKFFYSRILTRTRKRDVIQGRTLRNVQTINFKLNDYEKKFYDKVTTYLRSQGRQNNEFAVFRLIARQRQMTSCMAAALAAWRNRGGSNADAGDNDDEQYRYAMWNSEEHEKSSTAPMPGFEEFDVAELEKNDSKFNHLVRTLRTIIAADSSERIVIFSFFRHTVHYLVRRLRAEGIRCDSILGGISREVKGAVLEDFKNGGFNVLVSSEVGAEGIDLQFARYEVNYDLPWNPMRLEQRIGRIDRIGQKSPQIFILNAFCENTIEDRILFLLYSRISMFRDIIGDLEEILGKVVQNIEIDVFNKGTLTDEQIKDVENQIENAIANGEHLNLELSKAAGNLTAYQKFILDNISRAHENLRHVTPTELHFSVKDFLNSRFPDSFVEGSEKSAKIRLSTEARMQFTQFLEQNPGYPATGLTAVNLATLCSFGKNPVNANGQSVEYIDVGHPLIKWILSILNSENPQASCCASISLDRSVLPAGGTIRTGLYSFFVQLWVSQGYKKKAELKYYAGSFSGEILDNSQAEGLITHAIQYGFGYNVRCLTSELHQEACKALTDIRNRARRDFSEFRTSINNQNLTQIANQKEYIENVYNRRLESIRDVIANLRSDGKSDSIIKVNIGRLQKTEEEKRIQLEKLEKSKKISTGFCDVAVGILEVK